MNTQKQITAVPILVFGSFILGGLLLDAVLPFPQWGHRIFEVLWVAIWGSLVILWVILETEPQQRGSKHQPHPPYWGIDHPAQKPHSLDPKVMLALYRKYATNHRKESSDEPFYRG